MSGLKPRKAVACQSSGRQRQVGTVGQDAGAAGHLDDVRAGSRPEHRHRERHSRGQASASGAGRAAAAKSGQIGRHQGVDGNASLSPWGTPAPGRRSWPASARCARYDRRPARRAKFRVHRRTSAQGPAARRASSRAKIARWASPRTRPASRAGPASPAARRRTESGRPAPGRRSAGRAQSDQALAGRGNSTTSIRAPIGPRLLRELRRARTHPGQARAGAQSRIVMPSRPAPRTDHRVRDGAHRDGGGADAEEGQQDGHHLLRDPWSAHSRRRRCPCCGRESGGPGRSRWGRAC